MSCYYYSVINQTKDPIMKNVDLAIVLMMENSNRLKKDPFLLNLAKKTIIQYNKGFKCCEKPNVIDASNKDILHAYYTAFQYTTDYNNVLILEEDAEILYYTKSHYKIVDDYISGEFKIFSFANYGEFTQINENFYKSSVICGAHAQIISKSHRFTLMEKIKQKNFVGHIDHDYFCDDVVVYKYPLIVQLFTDTINKKTWNTDKTVSHFFIKLLEVDKNKSGWEMIHAFSKLKGKKYIGLYTCIIVMIFALIIYRK